MLVYKSHKNYDQTTLIKIVADFVQKRPSNVPALNNPDKTKGKTKSARAYTEHFSITFMPK